jgi:hypothetical protein
MLGIQLTEPALLLGIVGIILSTLRWARAPHNGPLPLIVAWMLLPAVLVVSTRARLYDNARQMYFILPPLFLAAGFTLDQILARLPRASVRAAVIVLAVLPGLLGALLLHPYEYVHYNSLVGGTRGAYGRFEMDYWGTSFKALFEPIRAAPNAKAAVLVYGPPEVAVDYAGPKSVIYKAPQPGAARADYTAILIRAAWTEHLCEPAPVIHSVGRLGAIFAVLRSTVEGARC